MADELTGLGPDLSDSARVTETKALSGEWNIKTSMGDVHHDFVPHFSLQLHMVSGHRLCRYEQKKSLNISHMICLYVLTVLLP